MDPVGAPAWQVGTPSTLPQVPKSRQPMASDPLQSLTIRLALDDELSQRIRQAADVLTEQGRRMGQAVGPTTAALERLDKEGTKHLSRVAIGAQETADAIVASSAKIDRAVQGVGGGQIARTFEQGAQGVTLLDAGATKLLGTLTGLAAGFLTVAKGVQVLGQGIDQARALNDGFKDLPVLLNLSAKGADALKDSIRQLAESRGLTSIEALAAVEESVRNGATSAAEALQVANRSLDIYTAGLAGAGTATKVVTDALSAYGRGAESAAEFTNLIGASLIATKDDGQQFAAGLDRLLPKAARAGAGLQGLLNYYGQLRAAGLPLQSALANVERSLDQLAEVDTQRFFANLGFDVSRAAVELRGIDVVVNDLARSFAGNAAVTSDLTSRGVGLGTSLDVIGRSGKGAAEGLDALTEAQARFIQAAKDGQESAATFAKRTEAAYDNLVERAGQNFQSFIVSAVQGLERFENAQRKLEGREPIKLVATSEDLGLQDALAGSDELQKSLAAATIAAQEAGKALREFDRERSKLSVENAVGFLTTGNEAKVARERAEIEQRILDAKSAQAAIQAQIDARSLASSQERVRAETQAAAASAAAALSTALAEDVRFQGFQESARRAIEAIGIPPIPLQVGELDIPPSVLQAAERLGSLVNSKATPGADALAIGKEDQATLERYAASLAQLDTLLTQVRTRALDGTERQAAEQQALLAGIEKQIEALQAEKVNVDALRAAFATLGAAEQRRLQESTAAQARQLADQRAQLGERVDALGSGLAGGLDAQFRAIDERVRATTREVDKFREARIKAGTATPEELSGLDALIAKAVRLGESLKGDARTKLGEQFTASLREIDDAVAGLGKGLQSGLDATFTDIDARVQGVLDRIRKVREDAAKSGGGLDTSALDAATARAILLGDALKLEAQTEGAREYLSVLADITRQGQAAALSGLPEAARRFGEASIELRAAQAEIQKRALDRAGEFASLGPAEAQELAAQSIDALQRGFDANARKLTLDFVLRPQLQIEEEALKLQLEEKLAPFAKRIQDATDARNASFNPDTQQFDPEKVRAVEEALRDARVAAQEFNDEIVRGSEAFGKGFSGALRDRINDATNDFATGAKLAGTAFDALGGSLGDAFFSIVEGSKSAKEAVKDFVKSFVSQIAQAISQALAFRLVASSIGFLGFGAGTAGAFAGSGGVPPLGSGIGFAADGGVFAGEMQKPRAFAQGGIMPGAMRALSDMESQGRKLPTMQYALGGVARSPQMAVFAEKPGMAEAFVPLPGPDRGIPVEFKNMPGGRGDSGAPSQTVLQNTVSVSFTIQALDGSSVREILSREARTIEDLVASAVSSGANRGLTESVRAAGNPARG